MAAFAAGKPHVYTLAGSLHILDLSSLLDWQQSIASCQEKPAMQVLEEKMTAKIMKEAREQNEDLEAEENVILASARNQSHQVSLTQFWQLLQGSSTRPMD